MPTPSSLEAFPSVLIPTYHIIYCHYLRQRRSYQSSQRQVSIPGAGLSKCNPGPRLGCDRTDASKAATLLKCKVPFTYEWVPGHHDCLTPLITSFLSKRNIMFKHMALPPKQCNSTVNPNYSHHYYQWHDATSNFKPQSSSCSGHYDISAIRNACCFPAL